MRRYSRRQSFATVADINVVPMVDLVFNLLIIFMLATPLLEQALEVQVPSAEAGAPVQQQTTRVIAVDRAGRIFLDDKLTDLRTLRDSMTQLAATTPDVAVLVRTDKQTSFEHFAKVVDVLKQANIKRMGIVTVNEPSAANSGKTR